MEALFHRFYYTMNLLLLSCRLCISQMAALLRGHRESKCEPRSAKYVKPRRQKQMKLQRLSNHLEVGKLIFKT